LVVVVVGGDDGDNEVVVVVVVVVVVGGNFAIAYLEYAMTQAFSIRQDAILQDLFGPDIEILSVQ